MTVTVVDYGSGNIGSVLNMLRYLGIEAMSSSKPDDVEVADRLILPGVGAFDAAVGKLTDLELWPALDNAVTIRGVPLLGICLGMQLLTRKSAEGAKPGFGWISADTVKFDFGPDGTALRVPHMGWNVVDPGFDHPLLPACEKERRFYFAHSYHVVCDNRSDAIGITSYGYEFASIVATGNVVGAQFHPERSHHFGMELLSRFVEID